ncbi:helix-turn-helix domain-containing protein [Enterococcus sp. DIV2381]|uniref:helix-turn-helix domain-containing protein n=2 Tax=Enterococcus TaxID=1350 RepID=UPI003D2BB478
MRQTSNNYAHVGQILNTIRKKKKISTKTIFAAGITRPTYYRFVRGEGEINLINFLKLLHILGIELSELEAVIPILMPETRLLENELTDAISAMDATALKKIKKKALLRFKETNELKYRYIFLRAEIMYNKWTGNGQQLLLVIRQIKDYLDSIDLWTNGELLLFSSITETLSYEEYEYFFKQFLLRRKNHEEQLDPIVLDLLYFGYYDTALNSKNKLNVERATRFVLKRKPNRHNYRFRIWRLFVHAARISLTKDYDLGLKKFEQLQRIIVYIFKEDFTGEFELNALQEMWKKVQVIVHQENLSETGTT